MKSIERRHIIMKSSIKILTQQRRALLETLKPIKEEMKLVIANCVHHVLADFHKETNTPHITFEDVSREVNEYVRTYREYAEKRLYLEQQIYDKDCQILRLKANLKIQGLVTLKP